MSKRTVRYTLETADEVLSILDRRDNRVVFTFAPDDMNEAAATLRRLNNIRILLDYLDRVEVAA